MNLKNKLRVTKSSVDIVAIYSMFLFLIGILGCNSEYDDDLSQSLTAGNLKQLEEKYHVKIENTNNLNLNADDLLSIEDAIISLKSKFNNLSCENVPLELTAINRIKTRSLETVHVSAWAFNLSWMHVSVGIDNDTSITIESWLTGVTIYNYQQKNLSHNFTPGHGQKQVSFNFTAVCTVALTGYVGINITATGNVEGSVNFEDGTGSLYVDGY